jgi:hypothetical protein
MSKASEAMTAAFQQGQRDREQGWPFMAPLWGFEGWAVYAYRQGYEHPRVAL